MHFSGPDGQTDKHTRQNLYTSLALWAVKIYHY